MGVLLESMGVLLVSMGVLHLGMRVLLVSMGVLLESLGVLLGGLHGSVTCGASACKLTFARAWAKIAAETGGGVEMGLGRERGLERRGRRVPASDPSMPIEILGEFSRGLSDFLQRLRRGALANVWVGVSG